MKTAAVLIGDVRSRGRGICPLPSSTPRGIWQLKCPHPREFAIQEKKNANTRGLARGAWAQLELTDALNPSLLTLSLLVAGKFAKLISF